MKNTSWLRLGFMLVIILTATSVFAQYYPTRVYKISNNFKPNTAMGLLGATAYSLPQGTEIRAYNYTGNAQQQWYIQQVGTDASTSAALYKIVNRNSGQALEGQNGWDFEIVQNYFRGDASQKWVIQDVNGAKKIINYLTGLVLSSQAKLIFHFDPTWFRVFRKWHCRDFILR